MSEGESRKPRYRIVSYLRLDPDEEEAYSTREEAQRALQHYQLLLSTTSMGLKIIESGE